MHSAPDWTIHEDQFSKTSKRSRTSASPSKSTDRSLSPAKDRLALGSLHPPISCLDRRSLETRQDIEDLFTRLETASWSLPKGVKTRLETHEDHPLKRVKITWDEEAPPTNVLWQTALDVHLKTRACLRETRDENGWSDASYYPILMAANQWSGYGDRSMVANM